MRKNRLGIRAAAVWMTAVIFASSFSGINVTDVFADDSLSSNVVSQDAVPENGHSAAGVSETVLSEDEISSDNVSLNTVSEVYVQEAMTAGAAGNVTLTSPLTINSGNVSQYEGCTIGGSITGATKEYLTVDGVTVNLTIKNLTIAMDTGYYAQYSGMVLKNNAVVNLTVLGADSFTASFGGAGIAVPEGCTLKITKESTGTLTACGGNYYGAGAGIGAVSNGYNPPSSGGKTQSVGTIEIDGGTVTAVGGTASAYSEKLGAAGIGGSMDSRTGKIIITGGTVTASGGESAAGIGGGYCGQVNEIDISGGQITATAGKNGGSAIGSGVSKSASASDAVGCGAISVTGGKISAYGNIGYGKDYKITQFYNGGSITISDKAEVAIYNSGVIYPASDQDQNGFYDLRFTIYDEDITKNCPVTVKFSGKEYSAELSVSGYTGQLSGKFIAAKGLSGKKRVSIVSDTKQWDFDIDFVDGTTGYSATVGKIYTYSAVISDARLVSDGTAEVTIAGRTYQAAMTVADHKGTLSGKFVRYEDVSESQNVKMVMNGITWQHTVSRSGSSYTVTIGTRICPVYLWFYDPGITADRTGVSVSVSRDGTEFGAAEMITDTKIEKTADGIGKMSLWMMEGSNTDITVRGSGLNGNSPVKLTAQTIVNKSSGNNLIMWDKSEVSVQVTTMDLSYGDISITEYAGKLKFTYYTDAQTQKTVTGQLCDSEYEIMQSNSTTATDHTISISGTASGTLKLKLNGINISTSTDRSPIDITDNAKVDLILCGTNMTVYNSNGLDTPSIHVAPLSELDIEGTGSIDTGNNRGGSKGYNSAGIGGRVNEGCGSINIKSGTVNAYGGQGAGIGSGMDAKSDSGQIRISGGSVTAGCIQTNAAYGSCCIGRGWTSNTNVAAPDVIITGGTFNLNGYNRIYGNTPETVKYTAGDTVTIDGAKWNVDSQTPDSGGKITIWLKNGTDHTIVSGSHTYDFVWKNSCFVPGNRVRITKDPEEEIDLPKGYSYTALPMVSIKAEKTENASDSDVITYQWYENGSIINNATGDLYYVPYKGVGKYVFTCRVTCGDTVIDSKEGIIRIYVNQGSCYLTMENWTYGDTPADPDSRSDTNTGVTPVYKYKTADADDSAYAAVADLSTLSAGRYSVRVVYPSTDDYSMATDETEFIVQQRPIDTSMLSAGTGYSKSPAVTVSYNGKTLTEGTDYTVSYDSTAEGDVPVTAEGMGNYTGTASVTVKIDRAAPSFDGDDCGISFADSQWKKLLSQVTFGIFSRTRDVTVKASDSCSGVDGYYYYIDKTSDGMALNAAQLASRTFTEDGDGIFSLDPDEKCVIYAYAIDRTGNKSGYICSQGITVDNTVPEISVLQPSGDDLRDVTAVLKMNSGESGTAFYVVRRSEEQQISANDIILSNDRHSLNVTAGIQVSDILSGLEPATVYHIYACVTDRAGNFSTVSSCSFTTMKQTIIQNVKTPVITPAGGTYTAGDKVSITCTTEGADIYYTTDGSKPTVSGQSSMKYTEPFEIQAWTTVKAVAVKKGMLDSAVSSVSFTVAADKKYTAVVPPQLTYGTVTFYSDSAAPDAEYMRYKSDGSIFSEKFRLMDFTSEDTVKLNKAGYSISVDSDNRLVVALESGTHKTVSVKAIVSGNGWSEYAKVPLTVRYVNKEKAQKQKIVLGTKRIYFNTAVKEEVIPAFTTSIMADNGDAFTDNEVIIEAAGSKASDTGVFDALTITKDLGNKKIKVAIDRTKAEALVSAKIKSGRVRLSFGKTSVIMTVNLLTKASGAVRLTTRESINLAERDTTYVIVIPKSEYGSSITVTEASIDAGSAYTKSGSRKNTQIGNAAEAFITSTYDSGTFIIAARSGVSFKTYSRLYVPVSLKMSDGTSMNVEVPVKIVSKVSKVKAFPYGLTYRISDTASQNLVVMKTGSAKEQYGEISAVTLEKSSDRGAKAVTGSYYSDDIFSYAAEGLTIKNASALKKNRSYDVRLRVKFEGQAAGASDRIAVVKVRIK